jgi:phenylalanyl-tRNA synthetase alpha chain
MTDTTKLLSDSLAAIAACSSTAALEEQRVALLGKKGTLTEALKTLGQASPEERKTLGAELNKIKSEISETLESKKSELAKSELNARLASETIDVTLPAQPIPQGRIHPVSYVIDEITAIFAELGFAVAEGPDIEDDYHNFDALNIPASHPARQFAAAHPHLTRANPHDEKRQAAFPLHRPRQHLPL